MAERMTDWSRKGNKDIEVPSGRSGARPEQFPQLPEIDFRSRRAGIEQAHEPWDKAAQGDRQPRQDGMAPVTMRVSVSPVSRFRRLRGPAPGFANAHRDVSDRSIRRW